MTSRRILITGTSRGLGQALAFELLDRGHLVVGCSRGPAAVTHDNYLHIVADIGDEAQVLSLFTAIQEKHGGIDVLINNAGAKLDRPALLAGNSATEEMTATNLTGTLAVTREALKLMKRGRFGRVVSITSMAVPLGSVGTSYYGALKAAVTQYGHAVVRELRGDDITLNTLGVSIFEDSEMIRGIDPETLKETAKLLPKPAPLEIGEIAHAVEFLISDWARNVTDQTIYFGGVR